MLILILPLFTCSGGCLGTKVAFWWEKYFFTIQPVSVLFHLLYMVLDFEKYLMKRLENEMKNYAYQNNLNFMC